MRDRQADEDARDQKDDARADLGDVRLGLDPVRLRLSPGDFLLRFGHVTLFRIHACQNTANRRVCQ